MMLNSKASHRLVVVLASILSVYLIVFQISTANADPDEDIGAGDSADDTILPSLWTAAMNSNYHVLYQLEMTGSIELIEEWADFNARLFRLDVIAAGGLRTSYLTNGHTREMFRYKPFECARSDGGSMFKDMSLIAPLFMGYVWDDHQLDKEAYFAYGLGPLWLRARKDGRQVPVDHSFGQHQSDNISSNSTPFEDMFNMYDLEFKAEVTHTQQPYRLRFYFAKSGKAPFVDTIDWFLSDKKSGSEKVENYQVRAKVIQVDYKTDIDDSVFKLPVGYGCSRRSELDPTLQIDVGQVLLHQGAPNQAAFEVITSSPNDDNLHASSWTSQKYSFRVLRVTQSRVDDSSKTESHYVTLSQFRELPMDQKQANTIESLNLNVQTKPRLKRIKKVWWAPDSDKGQATVYTIDQSTGECVVDHQDIRNQVLLKIGGGAFFANNNKPMVLSLDQISVLFDDFSSYHLIDEGQQVGHDPNIFLDRYYEKRVKNFGLKSPDGKLAWSGPVSIVKQVSTYSRFLDLFENKMSAKDEASAMKTESSSLKLTSDYKIKLVIFFYSEKLDRLLFKVIIDLLDNHEVSFGYAHEQMDVSSCFRPEEKQDIVLKYPLDSVDLSRKLENKRETIKLLIANELFWSPGKFLVPLQIYNIKPSFSPFYMHLQMSLLDMPLTHTFQMQRGLKLAPKPNSNWFEQQKVILKLTASNSDICAQHCEYYNCFMFSYEVKAHHCMVSLDHTNVLTAEEPTSELYTYFERRLPAVPNEKKDVALQAIAYQQVHERPHLSSDSIIQLFEQLIDAAQSSELEDPTLDALVLRINMGAPEVDFIRKPSIDDNQQVVTLKPQALEHNLETMNEYSRELDETDDADGTQSSTSGGKKTKSSLIRVVGDKQLKLQYSILLPDRTFSKYTGETLTGVTYEECEQHCELNDCRSFSYCLLDETCQVSGQHREKSLMSITRTTHLSWNCNIYALDYLSKFEPYGLVPAPLTSRHDEESASERDCATSCMDHQEFTCHGFYFCPKPATGQATKTTSMCVLSRRQAEDMKNGVGSQKVDWVHAADKKSSRPLTDSGYKECSYYSRSFLSQFDKYLGKEINLDDADERYSMMGSLEGCAKYCLSSKCLAFYACPTPAGSVFSGQSCYLALKSIKKDQLVPNKKCTTFVVSDKSHFNTKKLQLIYNSTEATQTTLGKPDKEAYIDDDENENDESGPAQGSNDNEQQQQQQVFDPTDAKLEMLEHYTPNSQRPSQQAGGGHSWLARLLSLLLGILLGFGFIIGYNEAYARGWTSRLSQFRPRLAR